MSRTELPADTVQSLAFDEAVGFFDEEQLAIRYGMDKQHLAQVRGQPAFKREVDEQRRLLYEDGAEFKGKVREHVLEAIDFYAQALQDSDAPWTVRAKAADRLVEWAGFHYMKPKEAGSGQVQLVINTNLDMGQNSAGGSYTVEAREAEEGEVVAEGSADGQELIGE